MDTYNFKDRKGSYSDLANDPLNNKNDQFRPVGTGKSHILNFL